ncbi:DctP family TRAP transporter solute-binding subunit [Kushneria indalinina]|uniref:Tripartite ATP-independent transporter DctP family solute receptor n=1 Tax=Kushneria indalinina DSM 14324 TaxID=1122140 RepID=A0A3D9E041_9GAMM|nr:DctP family TRAP transporter solute-binding subunit [Kushneria indalinina]REC96406.1 tripartite ATP-independent transporter DctP family solute receptor [Kushneria indalinina DSM 14324]
MTRFLFGTTLGMTLGTTAAALMVAMSVSSSVWAATTLRFAHPTPQSDLQHVLAEKFKEEVEKASDGDLKVQIFPNGQLGNDAQMIDGARSGIIDITLSGLTNFTGMVPEAGAFELPFMFTDSNAAYQALDGAPGEAVMSKLPALGLKGLAFPENGFREMTNNRGPIREPADLKGLRMRVNNSITLNNMFELLGANPQQLPVAELYTALETGVVDAQEHPLGIVVSFNFNEVQDYLSISNHAYSALLMVMNQKRFDSLTPEQQQIVEKAAADATAMQRQMNTEQTEQMITTLEEEGMEVNRDVDTAAFQQAIEPVWETFVDLNGDEMIKAIQAVSGERQS